MKIRYETFFETFLRSAFKILASQPELTRFGHVQNGGHVQVFSRSFLLKTNQIYANTADNILRYNALL